MRRFDHDVGDYRSLNHPDHDVVVKMISLPLGNEDADATMQFAKKSIEIVFHKLSTDQPIVCTSTSFAPFVSHSCPHSSADAICTSYQSLSHAPCRCLPPLLWSPPSQSLVPQLYDHILALDWQSRPAWQFSLALDNASVTKIIYVFRFRCKRHFKTAPSALPSAPACPSRTIPPG